jgi:hypothetical protein
MRDHYNHLLETCPKEWLDSKYDPVKNSMNTWRDIYLSRVYYYGLMARIFE